MHHIKAAFSKLFRSIMLGGVGNNKLSKNTLPGMMQKVAIMTGGKDEKKM